MKNAQLLLKPVKVLVSLDYSRWTIHSKSFLFPTKILAALWENDLFSDFLQNQDFTCARVFEITFFDAFVMKRKRIFFFKKDEKPKRKKGKKGS